MFDELSEALKGLNKSQQLITKNNETKFLMWITEMCFWYKKSPECVVGTVNKILKQMKKVDKKERGL